MDEAWLSLVPLEIGDELLEVLDRDAAGGAAAGDARQIGRVQTEFMHARLHARRHVAGAGGIRRDRQTAHGRLHAFPDAVGRNPIRIGIAVSVAVARRGIQSETRGIFLAGFEITEHRADGIALAQFDQEFLDLAAARRSHIHRGLVGFHFDDVLVGFHGVAGLDEEIDDGGLGDGLAELRHDDGNLGHGRIEN